jgi:decaprenyl-phosphate phosphoribosyltransferase
VISFDVVATRRALLDIVGTELGSPRAQQAARQGLLLGILRATRPRQWVKNLLVVAVPLAAGELLRPGVAIATAIAFACFTLTSSGIYLINDVCDVEEDRHHPTKRLRPIAAGVVPVRLAAVLGGCLVAAGAVTGLLALSAQFAAVIGTYAALSLSYSLWLRDQPVVDLGLIAAGFLLRAMAGGVASDLAMSVWFLLVASFGSLFIAAGKRHGELRTAGPDQPRRRSLASYSESYLRFVWGFAASVTITAYALWAFGLQEQSGHIWAPLSLAPFVLGVLRYAMDIDQGAAGAPEEIAFSDRVLQSLGALWLLFVVLEVSL